MKKEGKGKIKREMEKRPRTKNEEFLTNSNGPLASCCDLHLPKGGGGGGGRGICTEWRLGAHI